MASAGQAQAQSSQPIHFSSPSGQRFSWCRPWNRGAVGCTTSGYWTVSTFRNICRKVTPKPLIGLRKSGTGDLPPYDVGRRGNALLDQPDPVIVRQVQGRDGERAGIGLGTGLGRLDLGGPLGAV